MTYAGIDVSKGRLDLALVGPNLVRRLRFANDDTGRNALARALRQHDRLGLSWNPAGPTTCPCFVSRSPKASRWPW